MGFRGGGKLTPPAISWFSSTPAGIGLKKKIPSFNGEAKVAAKAMLSKMIFLKAIFRIFRETEPVDLVEFLL